MEDTKAKSLEMQDEDLNKVSGGYVEQYIRQHTNYKGMRDYDTTEYRGIYCDMCRTSRGSDDNPVIPFQGGHLCKKCIEKAEKELGRKIL